MGTYRFNQSRKVITVEKTIMDIEADSFDEAVEKARALTPFSDHEGAIDEPYNVIDVELDQDMVIELSTDFNFGQATTETWFGDKFLFDNTPENKTLNVRIAEIMSQGTLTPFYVSMAFEYMKRYADHLPDEVLYTDFMGIKSPDQLRSNINHIHRLVLPERYEVK